MLFSRKLSEEEKSFIREYVAEGLGEEDRKNRRKEMKDEFNVSIKTIAAITAWSTIRINQAMTAQDSAKLQYAVAPTEDLGEDVYEDIPENDASVRKKGGEHFDYNSSVKDAWRLKNREYVMGNTTREERQKMNVLMLPGIECIEAQMYIDMGFLPENITGVEGGDREAREQFKINAEKLGINYKLGRLENILPKDPTAYGVVSLDFLGQICMGYLKMMRYLHLDKRALLLTNMMGRRETALMQWRMKAMAYFVGKNQKAFTMSSIAKFGLFQAMETALDIMKMSVSPSLKEARDEYSWIEMYTNTGMERPEHKPYPELSETIPTGRIRTFSPSSQRLATVIHEGPNALRPIENILKETFPKEERFTTMIELIQPILCLGMGASSVLRGHKGFKYMSKAGNVSIPYLTDFMEVERPVRLVTDVRHTVRFLLENVADYLDRLKSKEEDRFAVGIADKSGRVHQGGPLDVCKPSDKIVTHLHSGRTAEIRIGKMLEDIRITCDVLGSSNLPQYTQNPQKRELIES